MVDSNYKVAHADMLARDGVWNMSLRISKEYKGDYGVLLLRKKFYKENGELRIHSQVMTPEGVWEDYYEYDLLQFSVASPSGYAHEVDFEWEDD